MARPALALFGDRGSDQVACLRKIAEAEGAQTYACDIQLGPLSRSAVTWDQKTISWAGMDFGDIDAVHIRCTAPNTLPAIPPVLHEATYNEWRTQFLWEQHFQSATYAFFEQLVQRGKLVINPLTGAYVDHNAKSQFYEKLRAWGFGVPPTLTTNDPEKAREFLYVHGEVVVKPAIGVGSTRLVTPADERRLDEFRICPVLMQKRIRGAVLRVHVVADTVVLALRILGEHVDSRTHTQGFEYFDMPEQEQQRIVRANRRLGLHYAAWDVMVDRDGGYYYLDCNPGPYVMWIGETFREFVLTQLVRYMVAYARTRATSTAVKAVEPWRAA